MLISSRAIIVIVVLFIALSASQAAPSQPKELTWREFTSPAGRFAAWFVGVPEAQVQTADLPPGKVEIHSFSHQDSSGLYLVSYADLPQPLAGLSQIRLLLNGQRDHLLSKLKGKLVSEKAVAFKHYLGREVSLDFDGGRVSARFYLADQRLYTIQVHQPSSWLVESDAAIFLRSLKLYPAGQPIPQPPAPGANETTGRFPGPPPKIVPFSEGVLRSKALQLEKPNYPPEASAAGLSGLVEVKLEVDEQGDVLSAEATGGHLYLQEAALLAAVKTKFKPLRLNNEPVRMMGQLTYKFVRA